MKSDANHNLVILTGCLCMMLFAGCMNLYRSEKLRVIPYQGEYTAELSADQVVDLMRAGGFSHEEILELGTDLHNALAMEGGAKIRNDQYTKAIFLVQGKQVFMTVKNGRDLLFDLKEE